MFSASQKFFLNIKVIYEDAPVPTEWQSVANVVMFKAIVGTLNYSN